MERDISVTELNGVYVVMLSKRALEYILGSVEAELRTSSWAKLGSMMCATLFASTVLANSE